MEVGDLVWVYSEGLGLIIEAPEKQEIGPNEPRHMTTTPMFRIVFPNGNRTLCDKVDFYRVSRDYPCPDHTQDLHPGSR